MENTVAGGGKSMDLTKVTVNGKPQNPDFGKPELRETRTTGNQYLFNNTESSNTDLNKTKDSNIESQKIKCKKRVLHVLA